MAKHIADMAVEISQVINTIGEDSPSDDLYANTVLGLIDRILADDYTGSGLFEAIDAALKKVEDAEAVANPQDIRLTAEELETIQGLRAGKCKIVLV